MYNNFRTIQTYRKKKQEIFKEVYKYVYIYNVILILFKNI